jgi:hypothetical protein
MSLHRVEPQLPRVPWADAVYREQALDDYRGNPLIEALPGIRESKEIATGLTYKPTYDEGMRSLSPAERQHATEKVLSFVQPLSIHIDLAHRLSRLLRNGLIGRNPVAPEYRPNMELCLGAARNGGRRIRGPRATGMVIAGLSGVGKSTALEAALGLDPQVILHTEYNGKPFIHTQIVHLTLQCPADSSVRALCINFIRAVDSLLGTEYEHRYVRYKTTVELLLSYMARIAAAHSLGLLVIDEIQHLASAKSGGEQVMLNFFSQLVNTVGVPVVLVGTPKAVDVLTSQFRHARRSTGQGDMFWDRLRIDTTEAAGEWQYFCERLWRYQFTRTATPLSPRLSKALYECSQGITDVVVKLYMLAQHRAIQTGTEKITVGHVEAVARDSLRSISRVLDALRRGDRAFLSKADDVLSKGLGQIIAHGVQANLVSAVTAASPQPELPKAAPSPPPTSPPRPRSARRARQQPQPTSLAGIVAAGSSAGIPAYDALKTAGEIASDALAV